VDGGSYFFTVNLLDRRRSLLVEHIELLRAAFRTVRNDHPFHIDAIVVLPDHLHCIWTLPQGDIDFSMRWRLIKGEFTRGLPRRDEPRSASRTQRRERGIWQRRFWEHVIRNDRDYARHVDYIHFNPVKHGLAARPIDWPHSSIHDFVLRGILTADWGTDGTVEDMELE
jgi:putative transposase